MLFRCQRLLRLQASACAELGEAIQLRQTFRYSDANAQALEDLQASLEHLREQNNPAWRGLLRSLRALSSNLSTLQRQLASASDPAALEGTQDSSLLDRQPQTLREAFNRIRLQLTPTSLLFRHALRMAIALVAGYAALRHPPRAGLLGAADHRIRLPTQLWRHPDQAGAADQRHRARPGGRLGAVRSVPSQPVQALFAVVAGWCSSPPAARATPWPRPRSR